MEARLYQNDMSCVVALLPLHLLRGPSCIWYKGKIYLHTQLGYYGLAECYVVPDDPIDVEVTTTVIQSR